MTDGSPNFSLATLRMFLSHFRLNEKTMDLAMKVHDHMRQRWSEHMFKHVDEERKTGVSLRRKCDRNIRSVASEKLGEPSVI
jgi:hypothetical protein